MKSLAALLTLTVLAAGGILFSSTAAQAAEARTGPEAAAGLISSPSKFVVDYNGDIASNDGRLYFAVTGMSKRNGVRTQVFVRRGKSWLAASPQFPSADRAFTNVYFLRFRGVKRLVPCMSHAGRDDEARFRCQSGNHWRSLKVDPALTKLDNFGEAHAVRGRLTARFSSVSRPKDNWTKVRIAEARGWRIVPRGPVGVFPCRCNGALAQKTPNARSGLVDVAMNALYTTRFIATLGPNGWSRDKAALPEPVRPSIVGSQFWPVRTSQSLLVPIHTISWEEPWTLSVYGQKGRGAWSQVGGRDLNIGAGNVQGAIAPVGNRVWAMWEEYPVDGTDDPTAIFASLINRAGTAYERTIKLWSGPFGFLSLWDATEHNGGPVFIYTRSRERDGRLAHMVVDMSHIRD